jgi:hypothetical protein
MCVDNDSTDNNQATKNKDSHLPVDCFTHQDPSRIFMRGNLSEIRKSFTNRIKNQAITIFVSNTGFPPLTASQMLIMSGRYPAKNLFNRNWIL